MPELLTGEEQGIINQLGKVWGAFLALPEFHPSDRDDFTWGIHFLQSRVMARAAIRAYPADFHALEKVVTK